MQKKYPSFLHSPLWFAVYFSIQSTWGLLQTLLGLVLFLIHFRCPHDYYYGSIRTKWPTLNGISLGLFIFTPNEEEVSLSGRRLKGKIDVKDRCDRISVHEYGHTYQSLILGPFYLFIIGIPSLVWSRSKYLQNRRSKLQLTYSSLWTEKWANNLGEYSLKRPSIKH